MIRAIKKLLEPKYLTENKIILPAKDNKGNDLAYLQALLKRDLCNQFGGYTVTAGAGGWWKAPEDKKDSPKIYQENVYIYHVSFVPTEENINKLLTIAKTYGKICEQFCMYVVINNKARIIPCK